jgi:hypothetical protein
MQMRLVETIQDFICVSIARIVVEYIESACLIKMKNRKYHTV